MLRLAALLGFFAGDEFLAGDSGRCTGEDSRPRRLLTVFCTAIWSVSFLNGSLRCSLASSSGVYCYRNSSIER